MSIQQKTYSISKVSELTGVTKNRIQNWCMLGYLPATEVISVGNRQHRRFNDLHIEYIRTIDCYRAEGFELFAAARKASQEISTRGSEKDNG